MIYVLVTRNVSDVETERGTIHLRVGERLYVRRDEVEALLLRGWLREIDPEQHRPIYHIYILLYHGTDMDICWKRG